jgi:hypothetical protein
MLRNRPIRVLDESEVVDGLGVGIEIFDFEIDIFGEPMHFRVAVGEEPAKLADIMPLARAIDMRIS